MVRHHDMKAQYCKQHETCSTSLHALAWHIKGMGLVAAGKPLLSLRFMCKAERYRAMITDIITILNRLH